MTNGFDPKQESRWEKLTSSAFFLAALSWYATMACRSSRTRLREAADDRVQLGAGAPDRRLDTRRASGDTARS
jgi:hypothetical protein